MPSSERTAAQAKTDCILKMGEEVGLLYSALWKEIAWVHKKWAEYVALFGTNPARIELMNRAAPSLFRTVHDSLWENVLLHLARLTDSPKSMGKPNLSVRRLAQAVTSSPIGVEVRTLEAAALATTEFARDWRNRKLAHQDLDLALDRHINSLEPASRTAVAAALASLGELLNAVSRHYLDSTTRFDLGFDGGDAVSLLHIVRDGLMHDEERNAKIKSGKLSFEHLRPEPL